MTDTIAPPANSEPTDEWWPSRFGAGDQAGALNEITAATVMSAAGLVRRGRVFDLSHVLHADIPSFPGRTFRQYLTTNYHEMNRRSADAGAAGLGDNSVNWVVEQITATQQMGTHMDALNHLQEGNRVYNGFELDAIVEDYGTNALGVDTLPQVVTRGLLVDVAGYRGQHLEPGDVITPNEVEDILAQHGLQVRPGDALLFHTGWGKHWSGDPTLYSSGEPGPGTALAEWIAEHRVALTGCDTWSYGPVPPEDPRRPFVVPQLLNTRHGVVVLENLNLAEAADSALTEFMLVVSHAKLRGATGAWVAPLAVI